MEKENDSNEDSKDEIVDNRNVKTIRSLRKHSAKKSAQSSKSIKDSNVNSRESHKDIKITKKKTANNKSRVLVSVVFLNYATAELHS